MEATLTTALLCPSCEKPMAFTEETHSYRCLACNPVPLNVPICKTQICKQPLTRLGEPWNCWICLRCNKHPDEVNKMKKEDDRRKRTYLDKKVTPEEVQKIVDVAIAKALAVQKPDYPPTRAEIQTMTAPENINAKPETYLQKAKRLGVATHIPTGGMRKKADVVADIEAKEVKKEIKAGQSVPGEDDEYARGLTEKDMI